MHPRHFAKTTPNKAAYIMANSGDVITYAELDKLCNQGAQLFQSLDLNTGDHIAIHMENNVHFMAIVWAAQAAGLAYTAVSTHLRDKEIAYIINDSHAKVLISSKALAPLALKIYPLLKNIAQCFMVNGCIDGFISWEEEIDKQPNKPTTNNTGGVQMLYSSGTTGNPKGILPSQNGLKIDQIIPAMEILRQAFGFNDSTIYLSPAPLYHAAPLTYNTITMYGGGTCIIMEKFDPERSLQLIEQYKVTQSQWVPIMFVRMLRLPEDVRKRYDLSSHKLAIHAAAPCPEEIKHQMIDWWGEIIFEYYGGTEGIGFTALNSQQWLAHPGSVGYPLNSELKLLDDDGNEVPQGEIGDIYFVGASEKFCYYNAPEKTAKSLTPEGWGTLGDTGYLDKDGFLYLSDRKDFMIISGGVNIYPLEIENKMIMHEEVADIAVFGINNAEFGQEVKAVIQPLVWPVDEEALERRIKEWTLGQLSSIKTPRSIDFIKELPRLENGKLYKRYLQQQYE